MGNTYRRRRGLIGWAQRINMTGLRNAETTVACWFMHLPDQAAGNAWDRYMLSAVTLADMPGYPPANRRYPAAEYELLLLALAPDKHPTPDDPESWEPMDPPNVIEQFHGISRDQVVQLVGDLAQACIDGHLMAEMSVYVYTGPHAGKLMVVQQLREKWTDTVRAGVHHLQTGGHHGHLN